MNDVDRIVAMLEDAAIEKRIAATIVLGEIKAKGPNVLDALIEVVEKDHPAVQRHALHAIARIGAKRVVSRVFPLLSSSDPETRNEAVACIASVGDEIVPLIRKRMPSATPEERRGLDAILADLGGKDAFTTLLSSLASSEGEAAKAAAIAVRQHVRTASASERRTYLAQTEKFLEQQKKAKEGANPNAVAAAIKILGFLEDEKGLSSILEFVVDAKAKASIRQEAILALRFALGQKKTASAKLVGALIDAATDADAMVAQAALLTLGGLEISSEHAKRLEKLLDHPEIERARFVIEQLGRQKNADAAKLLVRTLAGPDKKRAELAAGALAGNEHAVAPTAKALLDAKDPDRRWMMRTVIRPMASKVPAALRKELLETAIERLSEGERGFEAYLDVARDADSTAAADALRTLSTKLRKKDEDRARIVYGILCRSDKATDDDRYQRAVLELQKSAKDTLPTSRAGDESLRQMQALLDRGFDLASALRKDRSLELDDLYYVAFHFAEVRNPIGRELLEVVMNKGGRTKIGKTAKNKLALLGNAIEVD
jgi:HEAT repeat protein